MTKKPNLAAVVEAAGSTRRTAPPEPLSVPAVPAGDSPARPRTRIATKQIAAHFPEEVSWQLRELAVERRTTIQALMAEALNDLFQKHGKPEIVPVERAKAS